MYVLKCRCCGRYYDNGGAVTDQQKDASRFWDKENALYWRDRWFYDLGFIDNSTAFGNAYPVKLVQKSENPEAY